MTRAIQLLGVLLLCTGLTPAAPPTFTEVDVGLSSLEVREVRWGDANGDGKLDLIAQGVVGGANGNRWVRIYHNDVAGSGQFVEDPNDGVLPGINEGPVILGDYDKDGDLDLAYGGWTGSGTASVLFRKDGASWTSIPAGLRGMKGADGAWFDYDNDGDLDLILVGESYDPPQGDYAIIYRNNGDHTFTEVQSFAGVYLGQVSIGDFNNDGLLDVAITGRSVGSKIYRNTGGGVFVEVLLGLPDLINCAVAWGDYDNDGLLDFALCGEKLSDGTFFFEIYHNDGLNVFTPVGAGLPGIYTGELRWGDYDNDGDLDLLVTGGDAPGTVLSRVYRNDAGVFVDAAVGLTGLRDQSSAAWGDYDNDGKLDIAIAGLDAGGNYLLKVYHNDGATANTPPSAPSGLTATTSGNRITFSWAAATDAQTPAPGLTYNLRVGTTPGGQDVMAAMADLATGMRRVPEMGNVQHNRQWTLQGLPAGTYYYSVQAVDTAFAGSAWSAESSITIVPGPRVTAMTPAPGAVLGAAPAAITLTLNANLDPATVTASTVRLVRRGPDGIFAGGDDVPVIPASVALISSTQIQIDLTGIRMPNDVYRVLLSGTTVSGPTPSGLWTFDEAAGTAANDTSGNANHGTLVNTPGRISGKYGNALHFDGVSQYVEVPDADLLSTHDGSSGEMSVCAWVRIAALPPGPGRGVVLAKGSDPNTFEYQLFLYPDGTVSFSLTQPDNSTYGEARGGNFSANTWHHLAGTMKKGEFIRVYLDGLQIHNRLNFGGDTMNLGAPLRFGSAGPIPPVGPTPLEFLEGDVDDVRLFDHALTPDEVLAIATQGGGVRDASGAILDGNFSGAFPSGDNVQGGDFIAEFTLNEPQLQVTAMTPAPGSVLASPPATITLTMSRDLDPDTVNVQAIRLVRSGPDTVLGTLDDVVIPASSVTLLTPNQIRIGLVGAVMPDDQYRVTLSGEPLPILNRVNHWSLDDGTGFVAADSAGAANGAVIGPLRVPGRIGNALHFNGASDKVLLAAAPLAVPWTAGMWVKREDSPAVDARLMDPQTFSGGTLRLESYNDTNRVGVAIYTVADVPSNYTAPVGQWVHLTFVGTPSNTRLYVNGVQVDTMPAVLDAPRYYLGSHGDNTMLGTLDDVQLFSRNLSDGEILALASLGGALRDLNGNRLDGEFFGTLPSGNGTGGADFVANFSINTPLPPAPGAFALASPADASTGVAVTPTFTWGASTGATTYTIDIANDAGFGSMVLTQSGLAATTFTPGVPVTGGTTYYWRVTASNAGGNTVASNAPFSFQTVSTPPGDFTMLSPSDFATFVGFTPTFTWSASAGATSYQLQVAYDPAFRAIAINQTGITSTSFRSVVALAKDQTYYWRVAAIQPGGSVIASNAPFSFRTSGAGFAVGFVGPTSGGCGFLGLELLLPVGLAVLRRRRG